MTETELSEIIGEIKATFEKMISHSQQAKLDTFLDYYDDSPHFLSISADGKISTYPQFREACRVYYQGLVKQTVSTLQEKFQVLDETLVIMGWTGNIRAELRNGDNMIMNNYSITSVFKKINGKWKVIHDHESALPPEIVKSR